MVDRTDLARDTGFDSPSCLKRVIAITESGRAILSRSAMNPGRFGDAFAVEMETVQSDDSFLSGNEDELAKI